jgi:hypothetical protein
MTVISKQAITFGEIFEQMSKDRNEKVPERPVLT